MSDQFVIKNTNTAEYRERFEGREVVIPAGGTIKMTRSKAVKFLATPPPGGLKKDGLGNLKPESMKCLQKVDVIKDGSRVFVSERNGDRYQTAESMNEQDNKYNQPAVESSNVHDCPRCDFTSENAEDVLSHIGTEHIADDTSRDTKSSPVAI